MTPDAHARLHDRLTALRLEHAQAQADVIPVGCGDDADRATNIDAQVRLEMLGERIAALELDLDADDGTVVRAADGQVTVGDTVTVDFGDGPEDYLLGSVEHAGAGVEVITPGSPLGQALLTARVGTTVEYRGVAGRRLQATLLGAG